MFYEDIDRAAAQRLTTINSHLTKGTTTTIETMSSCPLTTHVLDATRGRPATGLTVQLYRQLQDGRSWQLLTAGVTNADGRCPNLVTRDDFVSAVYKLFFDTGSYFASHNIDGFYPYVEVVFRIREPEVHHHVPILLSPYSYSTYRGS